MPGRTTRIRVAIAGVLVAATVGGVAVAAGGQDSGSRYRTAIAEHRRVRELLHEVGTVEPVSQAEVSFPVAGTVASVEIAAGNTVGAGQVLATLETDSLEAALHEAQAVLDQAEFTLEQALAGEEVGVGAGPSLLSASSSSEPSISLVSVTTVAVTDDELRTAQEAVLEAKRRVDADLLAAEEALASAQEICAALEEPESDVTACHEALDAVLVAQQQVSRSQQALNQAAGALDNLLAERAADLANQTPDDPAAPTPPSTAPDSGGGFSTGPEGDQTQSSAPSSEELVAYQAAIDAAAVEVTVAEQALEQATIISPIAGTVVSIGIAPGDDVEAASDTAGIVIDGDHGFEVSMTVGVDDLPDLEVGQPTTVTPDGSDVELEGEVSGIGLVAEDGASASTYPVTVRLAGDTSALRNGAVVSIAVATAQGEDVLAVPTSAVHAQGGDHSVIVLEGDAAESVSISIGAVGPNWTEVGGGIEAGDVVVLADLDEPLPGSATDGSAGATDQEFPFDGGGGLLRRPGG